MSTVKISELPEITQLNSNTSNTLIVGVDIPTNVTGKITASTLARSLYSNNVLNVGNNDIIFPGVIGQFVSNNESYLQVNLQNLKSNGSSDYVATADKGTDSVNYIDMGIAGSTDEDVDYPVFKPMDGYLYVQGNTATTVGGNLLFGTTTTHRDISFFQGGAEEGDVVARFKYNTGLHLLQRPLTFADGTSQNTSFDAAATAANAAFLQANTPSHVANSAAVYANAAFLQANTPSHVANSASAYANGAFVQANTPSHVANSAAVYANGAFVQANAAFIKANNALANTTGTFAGDLTVTGNVSVKYALSINNASMPGNSAYLIVTGTAGGSIGVPSNPGYTFHSAVDGGNRVVSEAYSNTATDYASFIGRRARGTASSPLAIQSGDTIVRFGGNGYGTTKFSQFSDARIEFIATQNHTDTAKGTKIRFMNTPENTNTASEIATFNANAVTFTGTVEPQKGFVYTANVHGTLTALTIDFNRDSLVKFNVTADATITLSNYVYGKVVEVWITNSAVQNKIITHGCLSNNSTSKATTFTITSGACAYLRYFSIDGDQANTFVSITA